LNMSKKKSYKFDFDAAFGCLTKLETTSKSLKSNYTSTFVELLLAAKKVLQLIENGYAIAVPLKYTKKRRKKAAV